MTRAQKPPDLFDTDIEAALLGAVLIGRDEALNNSDVDKLEAVHFKDPNHQLVWLSIRKAQREEKPVDVLTLANHFHWAKNQTVDVVFLQGLINACPSHTNAPQYARTVFDFAQRRHAEIVISQLGTGIYGNGQFEPSLVEAIEELTYIKDDRTLPTTGWELFTLADAYKPRDPLVYVVEGLFSLPSLNIVYGSPGCLKSMILADLALCVASGRDWLQPAPDETEAVKARSVVSVPVLWLDFDNGKRRTDERMDAIGSAYGLDADSTPFHYASMPSPWLDGNDAVSVDGLATLAGNYGAGLIIIDNLGAVSGDADENSAQMVQVLANFRQLSERTGAAVVLVHHQRKSNGSKARTGETLRGHSSIEAALDLALLVERDEGAPHVRIQSTKTRGIDVWAFGGHFLFHHREGSTELARACFYGMHVKNDSKQARGKEAILEVLTDAETPPNKSTLLRMAREICNDGENDKRKVGVNALRGYITNLVQSGAIIEKPGAKDNARIYYLP